MSKWIDADEVAKLMKCGCAYAIWELPSIEIIRCKECKHYVAETDSGDGREWSSCEYWLREINDDDYCSYGERKESER